MEVNEKILAHVILSWEITEITGELDKITTKLQKKKKKSQSIDISFQFLLVLAR